MSTEDTIRILRRLKKKFVRWEREHASTGRVHDGSRMYDGREAARAFARAASDSCCADAVQAEIDKLRAEKEKP